MLKKSKLGTTLKLASGAVAAATLAFVSTEAMADAAIVNSAGDLAMGINDAGHHNILDTAPIVAVDGTNVTVANSGALGLAFKTDYGDTLGVTFQDATSPGCLCEGWGVSATHSSGAHSGYANESTDGGVNNLTVDSFTTSVPDNSITSAVHVTSLPGLKVTQVYAESTATARLFEDKVTITNDTDETLSDVRYVRVMDWDIPPTEFNETVTIVGTGTTTDLEMSTDDGFQTANPLDLPNNVIADCAGQLVDFVDCNTSDHGAYFRFNFGSLDPGQSKEFSIFYGAAGTEAEANAAIAAEAIELFSYGQHDVDPSGGTPATFIFGFKGVGGRPVIPAPEPGTLLLLAAGLISLAGLGRRRMS